MYLSDEYPTKTLNQNNVTVEWILISESISHIEKDSFPIEVTEEGIITFLSDLQW